MSSVQYRTSSDDILKRCTGPNDARRHGSYGGCCVADRSAQLIFESHEHPGGPTTSCPAGSLQDGSTTASPASTSSAADPEDARDSSNPVVRVTSQPTDSARCSDCSSREECDDDVDRMMAPRLPCVRESLVGPEMSALLDDLAPSLTTLRGDLVSISTATTDVEKELEQLEAARTTLTTTIRQVEKSIRAKALEMKQFIDKQADELLLKLTENETELETEMQCRRDDLQQILREIEHYRSRATSILEHGVTWSGSRSRGEVNHLHSVAGELTNKMAAASKKRPVTGSDVTFKPTNIDDVISSLESTGCSLLGDLHFTMTSSRVRSRANRQSVLSQAGDILSLSTKTLVQGLAYVDNTLFVVGWLANNITAFNATDGSPTLDYGELVVDGLTDPQDLVSCRDTGRLYVTDARSVWSVETRGDSRGESARFLPNAHSPMTVRPHAISVTSRRLLVTSPGKLVLYSEDSQELAQVQLPERLRALHSVELPDSRSVVVCHQLSSTSGLAPGKMTAISEIDLDGHVMRVCPGHFCEIPRHLVSVANGSRGFVAADGENRQVVLLGRRLNLERVLLERGRSPGLDNPCKLCLIPGRVAVAEWTNCRINFYNIHTVVQP